MRDPKSAGNLRKRLKSQVRRVEWLAEAVFPALRRIREENAPIRLVNATRFLWRNFPSGTVGHDAGHRSDNCSVSGFARRFHHDPVHS